MSQRVFILGGGRFGTHLATRLCEFGCEVVIGDSHPKRVEDLSEEGFHVVQMDADDALALKAAGVETADAVVVAIGENMQASILATLLLRELRIKKLVVRAVDVKHAQVLEKLGADLVVQPTRDMAYRLAERLRGKVSSERSPISAEYQLAHVHLGGRLHGATLAQANLPANYKVTVILINRPNENKELDDLQPDPNIALRRGDIVVVSGKRGHIDRFEAECGQAAEPG